MNRLVERGLSAPNMNGAYIASAPNPLSQVKFMKCLRKAVGMPVGLPAFEWVVRIGARFLLRTDPELALYGRYVKSCRPDLKSKQLVAVICGELFFFIWQRFTAFHCFRLASSNGILHFAKRSNGGSVCDTLGWLSRHCRTCWPLGQSANHAAMQHRTALRNSTGHDFIYR